MRSIGRQSLDLVFGAIEANYRAITQRKKAKARLKRIHGGYTCNSEYKSEVVPYWKKYGIKPRKFWYCLYAADQKKFDSRYIPNDMWFTKIVPYYNNVQFRRACEDKCMHEIWFPELKRPKTVAMNVAGVYYNGHRQIISKAQAIELCVQSKRFLVKPSIDSGEGRLIRFFDEIEVNEEIVEKAFDELGCNFIAQEVIEQHAELAKLNEKSLNTVRVLSFLFRGEVHILSAILRTGGSSSRVDNVGSGGYGCKIENDGKLNAMAVNKNSEWRKVHENGVIFGEVVVPSFEQICQDVKREHVKLAHFKIIGWDFAVDSEGDPVFIEYNVCPGQNQMTCGPTFGDLTDLVLEDVFMTKEYKNSKN